MKQFVIILLTVSVAVMLSSCLNVFQYVGVRGSTVEGYFKFVIDKSLFEMAGSFSDVDEESVSKTFEEWNLFEENGSNIFPDEVTIEPKLIDTVSEQGFSFRYSFNKNTSFFRNIHTNDFPLVPYKDGNRYVMRFPAGDDSLSTNGNGGDDGYAAVFLSGAKWRLIIEERYIQRITRAEFVTSKTNYALGVEELPGAFLIEIPFAYMLGATNTSYLYLY